MAEQLTWKELRTLLVIAHKQPGRLVDVYSDKPLTVEGLLYEHRYDLPNAEAEWNKMIRSGELDRLTINGMELN